MSTFWGSSKTMITDGGKFAAEDNEKYWGLRIDELCMAVQHFGMHDKRKFCKRLTEEIMQAPSNHDIADMSDLEGIPEAEAEIAVQSVGGKKFSDDGAALKTTWKTKYTVEEWPEVAYALTRMTAKDIREIHGMNFLQLKDKVAKEWPSRLEMIFPTGCDGMMLKTLQDRVINMLRLSLDELKEFKEKPIGRDYRRRFVDYVAAVRPKLFKAN